MRSLAHLLYLVTLHTFQTNAFAHLGPATSLPLLLCQLNPLDLRAMRIQNHGTTSRAPLDHLFHECLKQKLLAVVLAITREHRYTRLHKFLHQMRVRPLLMGSSVQPLDQDLPVLMIFHLYLPVL